ncbi:hypothetical protein [Paraburkholderia bryophila]|nr:hypothetical protein [Paraburkholderia bryophila]
MRADLQLDFLVNKEKTPSPSKESFLPNDSWFGIATRKASFSIGGLRLNL